MPNVSNPSAVTFLGSLQRTTGSPTFRVPPKIGQAGQVLRYGALELASSTGTLHNFENLVCLLDGSLFDTDLLAGQLGVATESRAEHLLIEGYRRWGRDLLPRLRGAFTLLIWDTARAEGLVARDHLGACPLYTSEQGGGLLFANELPVLLSALQRRPAPVMANVALWMALRCIPAGQTLYDGVHRVPPGHALLLGAGGVRTWTYWRPVYKSPTVTTVEEGAALIREHAATAVGRGVDWAQSPAVMMSGGLDSTSVAALGVRQEGGGTTRLRTYSALFPDSPEADETALIELVNAHLGVTSRSVTVPEPRSLLAAVDYLERWEAPCVSPNYFYNVELIGLAAREGVDLLFDGEGGDELFGGSHYLVADLMRRGRLGSIRRLIAQWPGIGPNPESRYLIWALKQFGVKGSLSASIESRIRDRRGRRAWFIRPWMRQETIDLIRHAGDPTTLWKSADGPRWWADLSHILTEQLEWMGANEYPFNRSRDLALQESHPFLHDVDLVEATLSIAPNLSFDVRHDRPLLRRAVADLLPREVVERTSKSYFDSIILRSLQADWPAISSLLMDTRAEINALAEPQQLRRDVLDRPEGDRDGLWAATVWQLLNVELWLRHQADANFLADLTERSGLRPAVVASE